MRHAFRDFRDLLALPGLDAVSICTPNAAHHAPTLAAAAAGMHVLCEKPISLSLTEADEMIAACREAGVVLQVDHHLRSNRAVERARAMIAAGELGRVTFVRLRQAHDWSGRAEVPPGFRTRALAGGGTLLDNGCHLFDLARYLGGPVQEVYCRTATLKFDIELEDTAAVSLLFESGALGQIETAWTATGWDQGFWVDGTRGALEYSERSGRPVLRHVFRDPANITWDDPDAESWQTPSGCRPRARRGGLPGRGPWRGAGRRAPVRTVARRSGWPSPATRARASVSRWCSGTELTRVARSGTRALRTATRRGRRRPRARHRPRPGSPPTCGVRIQGMPTNHRPGTTERPPSWAGKPSGPSMGSSTQDRSGPNPVAQMTVPIPSAARSRVSGCREPVGVGCGLVGRIGLGCRRRDATASRWPGRSICRSSAERPVTEPDAVRQVGREPQLLPVDRHEPAQQSDAPRRQPLEADGVTVATDARDDGLLRVAHPGVGQTVRRHVHHARDDQPLDDVPTAVSPRAAGTALADSSTVAARLEEVLRDLGARLGAADDEHRARRQQDPARR